MKMRTKSLCTKRREVRGRNKTAHKSQSTELVGADLANTMAKFKKKIQ